MDESSARLIVSSLLGRLRQEGGKHFLPEGLLSAIEVEALSFLTGEAMPEDVDRVEVVRNMLEDDREAVQAPRLPAVQLNMIAAETEGSNEQSMRLCLDFGTAMSKAWAAGHSIEDTIPLNLGGAVGQADSFALPSTIFIAESGRVFFGNAAEIQHRQEIDRGRQRFDNIKQILSEAEINQDLNEVRVDNSIDPTGSGVTKGDLLLLYLGWLTDHALKALEKWISADEGEIEETEIVALRSIRRRFAMPCFEGAVDETSNGTARSDWVKEVLRNVMRKAQVVADTLNGRWDDIRLVDALPILREIHKIDPMQIDHILAATPTVREPVAAGASRFIDELANQSQRSRRILLVVDAGAGTTDFAVFQVFVDREAESEKVRYCLISPTVKMSRIAGNEIDTLLRPLILEAAGVDPNSGYPRSENDFFLIRSDLNSQIREIKAILFSDGEVEYNLRPGVRGKLSVREVLEHPSYVNNAESLKRLRDSIVHSLFGERFVEYVHKLNSKTGKAMPIYVLLTGGSSSIPMVKKLASGDIQNGGAQFQFQRVKSLPEWIEMSEREFIDQMREPYPQCAVAIGGTAPVLPVELSDFEDPVTPDAGGEWTVERFQSQGL